MRACEEEDGYIDSIDRSMSDVYGIQSNRLHEVPEGRMRFSRQAGRCRHYDSVLHSKIAVAANLSQRRHILSSSLSVPAPCPVPVS